MESLLIASFIAGFLTVLAPCLLPLLPVVIGGSLSGVRRNAYIIIGSLLLSVIAFSIIIEGLTTLFYIPQDVWEGIAGVFVLFVGLSFLFPSLWTRIPFVRRLSITSNKAIGAGAGRRGVFGDIAIGAALGPAFSACSPTYLLILAAILSAGFFEGMLYLIAYTVGLGVVLLFIALLGQTFVERLVKISNERGWFKRSIGILLIAISIVMFTGADKKIGTYLLDIGFIDAT